MSSTSARTSQGASHAGPGSSASAEQIIAAAGLPEPLSNCVRDVLGGLRLWRSERASVARELCAHFGDGLARGESPEALLQAFGDTRQCARMMTRAKRLLRPRWWKVGVLGAQLACGVFACGLVAYGILWARTVTARPTITIDFVQLMNDASLGAPEADRAWPVYKQALAGLDKVPDALLAAGFPNIEPTSPLWADAAAYVTTHSEAIRRTREAAAKPTLGVPLTVEGEFVPRPWSMTPPSAKANTQDGIPDTVAHGVLNVKLVHLGPMRELTRLLAFDARRAAHEGDIETAGANVDAMLGLAQHAAGKHELVIGQLVSAAIAASASQVVQDILAQSDVSPPWLLARAQRFEQSMPLFATLHLQGERDGMHDLLQRAFTDDGKGDGRLAVSPQVWDVLQGEKGTIDENTLDKLLTPISTLRSPSRAELRTDYDMLLARLQQLAPLSLAQARETASQTPPSFSTSLAQRQWSALLNSHASIRLTRARVAATAFCLRHLAQAESSAAAEMPADPWTGGAARMIARGERSVVVYSQGEDLDDDNAAAVSTKLPALSLDPASPNNTPRDGDIILFDTTR